MRNSFILVAVLSFSLLPSTANAGSQNVDPVVQPCTGATADDCFHQGDWWYDNYYWQGLSLIESLDCGLTSGCKACGVTGPYGVTPVCAVVKTNASCECAIQQVYAANGMPAPGITQCVSKGSCTYRGN